jgi:hypothetical protein
LDVFGKRLHETLGVLRRKNNATFDFAFGRAGHYVHEINHKLGVRMGDDGKVGIRAFGHFFGDFDVDPVLGLLVLHKKESVRVKVRKPAESRFQKRKDCRSSLFFLTIGEGGLTWAR